MYQQTRNLLCIKAFILLSLTTASPHKQGYLPPLV
jgi:hypothetical protein